MVTQDQRGTSLSGSSLNVFFFLVFMTLIPVPSLSLDGWIYSLAEEVDNLLAHFFLANYSQTHLYQGQVSSFQFIIQDNKGEMINTVDAMRNRLTTYFSRYFTEVTFEVTFKDEAGSASRVVLSIYGKVINAQGKEYNLAKLVELEDSKFQRIVNINNG